MQRSFVLKDCSNRELLAGAKQLAGEERATTAFLIAHLAEIDARGLHLDEGFSCLSKYCMGALGLSEEASYRRADAALLARTYPIILDMLAEGSIHLTTLRIIGGCLTAENHKRVLGAARHKSKQQLEVLKAALCPQPDVPVMFRKLPGPGPSPEQVEPAGGLFRSDVEGESLPVVLDAVEATRSGDEAGANGKDGVQALGANPVLPAIQPAPPPVRKMAPLSPERYKLQLTLDEETYQALRQLQDLLRHQVPNGDLRVIIKDAVLERLARVQCEKFGRGKRFLKNGGQTTFVPDEVHLVNSGGNADTVGIADPDAGASVPVNSRHIPIAVRQAVWDRDHGQCAFVSRSGRRCADRGRLEFHHVHAYALGGQATVENIALRCRAHNAHEGARLFGGKGKKLTGAGASAGAYTSPGSEIAEPWAPPTSECE